MNFPGFAAGPTYLCCHIPFTMEEPDEEYAPQSPDLSAYHSSSYEPQQHRASYYPQPSYSQSLTNNNPQPFDHNLTSTFSNNDPYPYSNPATQPPYQAQQYPAMPRNGYNGRSQPFQTDAEWTPNAEKGSRRGKNAQPKLEEDCGKPAPGVEEGIKVATKFPVARIKRIMQADEDVGKVAQVTPTAVCK